MAASPAASGTNDGFTESMPANRAVSATTWVSASSTISQQSRASPSCTSCSASSFARRKPTFS